MTTVLPTMALLTVALLAVGCDGRGTGPRPTAAVVVAAQPSQESSDASRRGLLHRLTGFATLPAETWLPGPTSGHFIDAANGIDVPFTDRQPLQGISSAVLFAPNTYLAVSDNGFGARDNSADYLLRTYRLSVRLDASGRGRIVPAGGFLLSDPDGLLGFPLVADAEHLPGSDLPVPEVVREQTLLTGADLDPESLRPAPDGGWWFGDEFGPFLIRTDGAGRVVAPPVQLPGITSPQNPFLAPGQTATIGRSAGFEALGLTPSGQLLAMLEKPLPGDGRDLRIFAVDAATGARREIEARYRLDPEALAATDLTHVVDDVYLVIERDDGDGPTARFKRIYAVDLAARTADGYPRKRLVLDLLAIDDPDRIASDDGRFAFPFQTPETVVVLDERTLAVFCDNNFPFGNARAPDRPDPTEWIRVRFEASLRPAPR